MNELDHKKLIDNPLKQPMAIRYFLWLAIGKALRLPIAELMESINIQLAAAKRERGSQKAPFTNRERMRLAELGRKIGKPIYTLFQWIVSPEALIRWLKRYQERQVQQQEAAVEPTVGRPPLLEDRVVAILRIYDSGLVGLKRIRGELRKLGIELATSTIRKTLDDNGRPPGSNRTFGSGWMTFWRNHAPDTIGIDFLQVAVGLFGNISYRFVLIAIEHDTRKLHVLGITQHPNDFWLHNIIAAATMDGEPLAGKKYWIHDNDGKFQTLPGILESRGLKSVNISVGAPDMNAFAERVIRSIKNECFDHMVFTNEKKTSPCHERIYRALQHGTSTPRHWQCACW